MAKLEFNVQDHPELLALQEANKVMPNGVYRAHITDSKWKLSGAGHEYLELVFTVLGVEANAAGETGFAYKGRKVWENCNLNNPNEKSRAAASLVIATILQSIGLTRMSDTSELHGVSMLIKIKARDNDPDRNEIDSKPWSAGIMPDPNLVVDEAVRAAAMTPAPEQVWGHAPAPQAPVAQAATAPQMAAMYTPPASHPVQAAQAQTVQAQAYAAQQMAAQYGGNGTVQAQPMAPVQPVGEDELPF